MTEPERLRARVWSGPRAALREPVERLAAERREAVYAVGGIVRDLLLERAPADLDLVVDGDGVEFAVALARRLGVRPRVAERFLTVELRVAGVGRVDVAAARRERYPRPAALPEVEPGSLDEDLARRDFTVNTLAVGLAGPVREGLLGHPAALEDLCDRRIRVLHAASFRDDPTRLLRGVTLEVGLGGRMVPATERLAGEAIAEGRLEQISGPRVWPEIDAALTAGARVARTLDRWRGLGLFEALLPPPLAIGETLARVRSALAVAERLVAAGGRLEAGGATAVTLAALAWDWSGASTARWLDRFRPPRPYRRLLRGLTARLEPALAIVGGAAGRDPAPSEVHEVLRSLSVDELSLLGALAGEGGAAWVEREVGELRPTRLLLRAEDLIARGVASGPDLGRALEATRAARLDGRIEAGEELDYALDLLEVVTPGGESGWVDTRSADSRDAEREPPDQ